MFGHSWQWANRRSKFFAPSGSGVDGERSAPPGRRCSCLPYASRRPSAGRATAPWSPRVSRELGDAQRSHRVRDHVWVRAVDEASPRTCRPVYPASVALEQSLSRQTFLRVLRMEIEGEPRDLRAEPALEPVGRRLADAAERSDVVGPDEDFVLAHSGSSRRMSSTVSRRRMTRASPSATSTAAGRGTAL